MCHRGVYILESKMPFFSYTHVHIWEWSAPLTRQSWVQLYTSHSVTNWGGPCCLTIFSINAFQMGTYLKLNWSCLPLDLHTLISDTEVAWIVMMNHCTGAWRLGFYEVTTVSVIPMRGAMKETSSLWCVVGVESPWPWEEGLHGNLVFLQNYFFPFVCVSHLLAMGWRCWLNSKQCI